MKKLIVLLLFSSINIQSNAMFKGSASLTCLHGAGKTLVGKALNIFAVVKNPWATSKFNALKKLDAITGLGSAGASAIESFESNQRRKTFGVAMGIKDKQLATLLSHLSSSQKEKVELELKQIEESMGVQGIKWIPYSKEVTAAWRRFRARREGMAINEESSKGHWSENYIVPGTAAGLFYLSEKLGEKRGEKKQEKKDSEKRELENRIIQNILLRQQDSTTGLQTTIAKSIATKK